MAERPCFFEGAMNEIIVVEGLHDQQRLQQFDPTIECILTNGSSISEATLRLIEKAHSQRGVLLLLDPDHPGRKITNTIVERIPNVKIAFIEKQASISKNQKKVGVEHASDEAIAKALGHHYTMKTQNLETSGITMHDLNLLGLQGQTDSKARRMKVSEAFHLPPCNAKALLKWLRLFHISMTEIQEVLKCQN